MKTWLRSLRDRWLDRPLRVGRTLHARYRITEVLGMGSYGISYLCQDEHIGQPVVVKQVKPSKQGTSKGRPVYEYETALLAELRHPAIPQLLDRFEEDGGLFFTMEYMAGPNFEDLIFDHGLRLTEYEALVVIEELLDIVEYLHQRGIIHRDVRIPNVIRVGDRLRLIDFGLSRRLGDAATYIAADLDAYHEEKQIKREVACKSDFYALGHFLLFLLYSTYESQDDDQTERSWEEELRLTPATHYLLRRLLQLDEPYEATTDLRRDLQTARHETKKSLGT